MVENQSYWNCRCKKNYIHPRTQAMCPYCGVWADGRSDSIAEEVKEMQRKADKRLGLSSADVMEAVCAIPEVPEERLSNEEDN